MRRRVVAILITAIVVLSGPATPAQADSAPNLELVSAEVLAKGAAARVTLDVQCDLPDRQSRTGAREVVVRDHEPEPYSVLSVVLAQPRTGDREASIFNPGCGRHAVIVLPQPGAPAFRQGKAAVRSVLSFCSGSPATCSNSSSFDFRTRLEKGGATTTPPDDPLHVVSATLERNGAAVEVVLEGNHDQCDENGNNSVSVAASISQRVGRTTTQSSSDSIACPALTGGPFRSTLQLPVQLGQRKFQARRAFIQATITYCAFSYGCSPRTVESIIRLTQKPMS